MAKSQKTRGGHEIAIRKRGDFFTNLKKAVVPEKSKNRPKKK